MIRFDFGKKTLLTSFMLTRTSIRSCLRPGREVRPTVGKRFPMTPRPLRMLRAGLIAAAAIPVAIASAQQEAPSDKPEAATTEMATQARDILRKHCYECHGAKREAFALNVALHATVVDATNQYIVPKSPGGSLIWQSMAVAKRMPKDRPRPSSDEIATIERWINAGAPAWPVLVPPRPFVSEIDVLTAIRDDLAQANPDDRRHLRYFSLANLHNNWRDDRIGRTEPVHPDMLKLARAALSKACNSMSWEPAIAAPKIVSKDGVVLRIDLRDFGWDSGDQWVQVLRAYPYGLKFDTHRDVKVRQLAEEVYRHAGTLVPCVRLDWFLDTATRPPLYHRLLDLPTNVSSLEKELRVDVESDFRRDRLSRAGRAESGVSRNNRLVDRHPAAYGAYWKSYDFAKSDGKGNLFKFPLGPVFEKNDYNDQAFVHDGGEMIFNLPNRLQGYYLSNAKGERLDAGPVEIVRDLQETSGSPAVVNGLSCMACHVKGIRRFEDTIREGLAVEGNARLKVDRLFPENDRLNKLLDQDEATFLDAVAKAMSPYLSPEPEKLIDPKNYEEPVSVIARGYQKDISIEEAAAELGFDSPAKLKLLIENNRQLRLLGLGPLAAGASIKREAWSSTAKTRSVFQHVAAELDIADPHSEF